MSINSLKPPKIRFETSKKMIWALFGHRAYARNHADGSLALKLSFTVMFAGIGLLGFYFIPFKILGVIILLGFLSYGLLEPIRSANTAPLFGWINLVLGCAGVYFHWHIGMTLFDDHFEFVLFWAFVVSGVLSIIRYLWNALIWKLLDHSGYQGVR